MRQSNAVSRTNLLSALTPLIHCHVAALEHELCDTRDSIKDCQHAIEKAHRDFEKQKRAVDAQRVCLSCNTYDHL